MMNTWTVGFLGLAVAAICYRAFAHKKWQAFATRAKQRRQLRSVITVKVVVRRDGRERVSVFHRPDGSYGVAIEQVNAAGVWGPADLLDAGATFGSVALALREASTSRPWCLAEEIYMQPRGPAGEVHGGAAALMKRPCPAQ